MTFAAAVLSALLPPIVVKGIVGAMAVRATWAQIENARLTWIAWCERYQNALAANRKALFQEITMHLIRFQELEKDKESENDDWLVLE